MNLFEMKKEGKTKTLFLINMNDRLEQCIYEQFYLKKEEMIILKSFDAMISKPYGDIIRNILIAIYEENVREIYVIGEKDSHSLTLNKEELLGKMRNAGVADDSIKTLEYLKFAIGDDVYSWLKGNKNESGIDKIFNSVSVLSNHPLIPKGVTIHGMLFDQKGKEFSCLTTERCEEVL